jgi:integrase
MFKLALKHWLQGVSEESHSLGDWFLVLSGYLRSPQLLRLALPRHMASTIPIGPQVDNQMFDLSLVSASFKSVAIIMLGQGMRPDEVFRMTYSNLDFFNRTILIVRGKTRNAKRTLSMSQEVHELLKQRRQSQPDDYWVFPSPRKPGTHLGSVRKAHDRVCEAMGLRGAMDLYNLRHTFAARSILSGTDVTILQKILGHSEIGMTMRYVKIAEHYKVEAVVKLENYRAVKMQEVEEKMGMVQ